MSPSVKKILPFAIGGVILILLGVAGFLLYPMLMATHEKNTVQLEKFGFTVLPGAQYRETIGELGNTQLPATFAQEELTPEEKVVASLITDRNRLIEENTKLSITIDRLESRIEELEDYKQRNEQYAPDTFNAELARVLDQMRSRLKSMPETAQFSELTLELMAVAAQQEYVHIVRANDLILDERRKAVIVDRYLPSYSFCVGNALSVATNSQAELENVRDWMLSPQTSRLSPPLQEDLDLLLPPCQLSFRTALQEALSGALRS